MFNLKQDIERRVMEKLAVSQDFTIGLDTLWGTVDGTVKDIADAADRSLGVSGMMERNLPDFAFKDDPLRAALDEGYIPDISGSIPQSMLLNADTLQDQDPELNTERAQKWRGLKNLAESPEFPHIQSENRLKAVLIREQEEAKERKRKEEEAKERKRKQEEEEILKIEQEAGARKQKELEDRIPAFKPFNPTEDQLGNAIAQRAQRTINILSKNPNLFGVKKTTSQGDPSYFKEDEWFGEDDWKDGKLKYREWRDSILHQGYTLGVLDPDNQTQNTVFRYLDPRIIPEGQASASISLRTGDAVVNSENNDYYIGHELGHLSPYNPFGTRTGLKDVSAYNKMFDTLGGNNLKFLNEAAAGALGLASSAKDTPINAIWPMKTVGNLSEALSALDTYTPLIFKND